MTRQNINNIRLGLFILAGLLALILAFYFIGQNQHLFGAKFKLKARFNNLNGLIEGNNVLYAGIQAGTVNSINLINDSTIEVTLLIDKKIRSHIHQQAIASIGTEGLMGNKIVNIVPGPGSLPLVQDGDLLAVRQSVSTDEMLQTLSRTNQNIAGISEALKVSVLRLNHSKLMDLLDDPAIGKTLKSALENINRTAAQANHLGKGLNQMINEIKRGKGMAGVLLSDTSSANQLRNAVANINQTVNQTQTTAKELNNLVININSDIQNSKGALNLMLRDTATALKIRKSLEHIEQGTNGFNQNMEALKHNFLLRGYFKQQEKQAAKAKPKK